MTDPIGGVQVTYDEKKISRIRTVHSEDGIPKLQDVDRKKQYLVVIPSIMYRGKSVYNFLVPEMFLSFLPNDKNFLDIGTFIFYSHSHNINITSCILRKTRLDRNFPWKIR